MSNEDKKEVVSYLVFESSLAREERHNKRLFYIILVLIVLWFATIIGGIWYMTLPVETYSEISQEADDVDGNLNQQIEDNYGEDKTN